MVNWRFIVGVVSEFLIFSIVRISLSRGSVFVCGVGSRTGCVSDFGLGVV